MSVSKEDFVICRIDKLKAKMTEYVRDNVMTSRQRDVHKAYYELGKSQLEIALEFKLSQPTVSRHLKSADEILDKYIKALSYSISDSDYVEFKTVIEAEKEIENQKELEAKLKREQDRLKREAAESLTLEELQELLDGGDEDG